MMLLLMYSRKEGPFASLDLDLVVSLSPSKGPDGTGNQFGRRGRIGVARQDETFHSHRRVVAALVSSGYTFRASWTLRIALSREERRTKEGKERKGNESARRLPSRSHSG